jgi:hypothetical protein
MGFAIIALWDHVRKHRKVVAPATMLVLGLVVFLLLFLARASFDAH